MARIGIRSGIRCFGERSAFKDRLRSATQTIDLVRDPSDPHGQADATIQHEAKADLTDRISHVDRAIVRVLTRARPLPRPKYPLVDARPRAWRPASRLHQRATAVGLLIVQRLTAKAAGLDRDPPHPSTHFSGVKPGTPDALSVGV